MRTHATARPVLDADVLIPSSQDPGRVVQVVETMPSGSGRGGPSLVGWSGTPIRQGIEEHRMARTDNTVHQVSDTSRDQRPGWPEVLAAAVVYALARWLLPPVVNEIAGDDDVVAGLGLAALSGILGLLAFAAAYVVRIRRHDPDLAAVFGLRAPATKWWFIAIGMGVAAYLLTRVGAFLYVVFSGDVGTDVQGDYRAAASGGLLAFILQLLFIAVLTPIGEEFAFRAVLTNALIKYGVWVSVIVSTIVFALVHGWNTALIPAVVVGVINGILFVRSRSVWPGVVVHAVNNAIITVLPLLAAGSASA